MADARSAWTTLNQAAVDANKFQGKIWAFPESTEAVALWYNKKLVRTAPATSIDDLLKQAAEVGLAYNTGFYHSAGLLLGRGRQGLRRQPGSVRLTTGNSVVDASDVHQECQGHAERDR